MPTVEEHFQGYLSAVLDGDRRRAQRVVAEARADGLGIPILYLQVFQRTLREIGQLWQEDRITVADEHLATAITQALMAHLYLDIFDGGVAGTRRSLIAACADVERHEVGLRMICDLLEMEGWDTTYLGATVPVDGLIRMVRERSPDVVALSVALLPHVPQLQRIVAELRASLGSATPLVMVGGRPFMEDPSLAERIGADLTASDAMEAVARLRERFAA